MRFDLTIEFSEIRSLMNLPVLDAEQRGILWETIQRMARAHPDVYASEWVPYLEAFPHHWTEPLFSTFSTRARHLPRLEAWCALIPFGCFNLNVSSRATPSDLHALLTSETFARVHALTLHHTPLHDTLFDALSAQTHNICLRALHLEHVALHDGALDTLLSLARSRPLERLVLPDNELTDACVDALVTHQDAPHLHILDLSQNSLTDSSLALIFSSSFESLRELKLSKNHFTGEGIQAMESAPRAHDALPHLTHLDLSHHALTHEHLLALCDARFAPNLTHLTLQAARLDDRAARVIMDSELMARLAMLDIRFNHAINYEVRDKLGEHASNFPQCTLRFTESPPRPPADS